MSFVAFKVLWQIFQPANLLVIALALATGLLFTRWYASGRALVVLVLAVFLAVAILPLGPWLITPLENRFPAAAELPAEVDGILLLGGASQPTLTEARGQAMVNGNAERILGFVGLALRYPRARLAFSGGSGALFPGTLSEADVVRRILDESGFDTARVRFEDRARDTRDNAIYLREALKPERGETWLLVTSARHMPRAAGTFYRLGWDVVPYPVDYRTPGDSGALRLDFDFAQGSLALTTAAREWIGLAAYYLSGRTAALFPGPDDRPR